MTDVRNLIIQKAGILFARFGLNKTTIDDIAKSLHMGKSSLYHYFKGKEEIFRSVLELELTKLRMSVAEAVRDSRSPKEKLQNFVAVRMQFLRDNENIRNAIREESLSFYDFVIEVRKYFDQLETSTIKQILKEGIDKGIFTVKDIISTSQAIIATIKGLEYKMELKDKMSPKHLEKLISVILNGISKRNTGSQK